MKFLAKIILLVAIIASIPRVVQLITGEQYFGYTTSLSSYGPHSVRDFNYIHGSVKGIPSGSLVTVESVDPIEIEVDDIVAYVGYLNGYDGATAFVMFTCASNDPTAQQLITYSGYQDETNITPVPYSTVVGRVTSHIPLIGDPFMMMTNPKSLPILIGIYIIGLALYFIGRRNEKVTQKEWNELSEALRSAEDVDDLSIYTDDTASSFTYAKNRAENALGRTDLTKRDVRNRASALRAATSNLERE